MHYFRSATLILAGNVAFVLNLKTVFLRYFWLLTEWQSFTDFHTHAEDSVWSWAVVLMMSLGRVSLASFIFLLARWKASDRENKVNTVKNKLIDNNKLYMLINVCHTTGLKQKFYWFSYIVHFNFHFWLHWPWQQQTLDHISVTVYHKHFGLKHWNKLFILKSWFPNTTQPSSWSLKIQVLSYMEYRIIIILSECLYPGWCKQLLVD